MQFRTFALLVALAGCKSSADRSASGSSSSAVESPGASSSAPKGRSGKIELPTITPSNPTPRSDDEHGGRLVEHREAMTRRLDTNGDGQVSDDERAAARQQRETERTTRLDTDGDGKVSDEERTEAMTERAANMHARFDTDEDGKLTPAELAGARRFRGDASKADANGDGTISVDELQKAMGEMRRGRFRRDLRGSGSGSGW